MARAKPLSSKSCSVCKHPERHRIEMLRLAGSAADTLASRFALKRDAIYRHMANHVSNATKAALIADTPLKDLADRAAAEGVSLIDYLSIVRSTVVGQMLATASINDAGGTAMLAGKAIDVLKEIGKLTGEMLRSSPITNIINNNLFLQSPAFNRLEQMLLERLTPYPEAMQAVLGGLEALEHEHTDPEHPLITLEAAHAVAA